MERNRDSRKTGISGVNGSPRRLQRITELKDSPAGELHEKASLRDRERLNNKKDRDHEYLKRKRVDWSTESYQNESTDTSDEEYREDDEDGKAEIYQTNRHGIRSLRSSPAALRDAPDEVMGVVIPRRARSGLARRSPEQLNPDSGEDLGRQRLPPEMDSVSGVGGISMASSVKKKKMKSSVETRTRVLTGESVSRPHSMIEEDIEIEVAEALFDLMQQSHSTKFDDKEKCVTADNDEMKSGEDDENNAFSVQNEASIKANAETNAVGSADEMIKEGMVDGVNLPDDPLELVRPLNKEKVGSSRDNESPSFFQANACDNQSPTVTKAGHVATVVTNANEAHTIDKDLMVVPSVSDKDDMGDMAIDHKVRMQNMVAGMQKEKEAATDISNQSVISTGMDQKILPSSSLLPLPIEMNGWPGILPYPGYMPPPLQSVLPVGGAARSSIGIQNPQFNLSLSRKKRCATQYYIASNIHHHQQLRKESLNSATASYGVKLFDGEKSLPLNVPWLGRTIQEGQALANISGRDRNHISAIFSNSKSMSALGLQQNPNQAPAGGLLHGPGFIFPVGYHQATGKITTANQSVPSQPASGSSNTPFPSNSAVKPSVATSSPSIDCPTLYSKEAAASYMAMLHKKGGPQFPAVPLFGSSLFNVPPNQLQQFSQSMTSAPSDKQPPQSQQQTSTRDADKIFQAESATAPLKHVQPSKLSSSTKPKPNPRPGNSATISGSLSSAAGSSVPQFANGSLPVHLMNFAAVPPQMMMMMGRQGDPKQQDGKNRAFGLIPQEFAAFTFGSNISPTLNFSSSLAQTSASFQTIHDNAQNSYHQLLSSSSQQKNLQAPDGGKMSTRAASGGNHRTVHLSKSGFTGIDFRPSSEGTVVNQNHIASSSSSALTLTSSGVSVSIGNIQQLHQQHHLQLQMLGMANGRKVSSSPSNTTSSVFSGIYKQLPENYFHSAPGVTPAQASSQTGNSRTAASAMSQMGSTLPAQETDGPSPKTSPVCRGDVPSILSTCKGQQVPELKN